MVSGAVKTCIAVFFLALSHVAAESQQPAPDLVLLNGKIFTSDTAHRHVCKLSRSVVEDDPRRRETRLRKSRPSSDHMPKQIDLGGRTVIPGINDAHNHLGIAPPNHIDLELPAGKRPRSGLARNEGCDHRRRAQVTERNGPQRHDSLEDLPRSRGRSKRPRSGGSWQPQWILQTLHESRLDREQCSAGARAWHSEGPAGPDGGRFERSSERKVHRCHPRICRVRCRARIVADQTSEADALSELRKSFSEAVKWGITSIQDMSNDMPPDRCVALRARQMPSPYSGSRDDGCPATTCRPRYQRGKAGAAQLKSSDYGAVEPSGCSMELRLKERLRPRASNPTTVGDLVLHEQMTFPKIRSPACCGRRCRTMTN